MAVARRASACDVLAALASVLALAPICSADARADDASSVDAEFARAVDHDDALELAAAFAGYERVLGLAPNGPHAAAAETRVAYLGARREGDFEPLVTLERVRRDHARASDEGALRALGVASSTFAPGLVRCETWLFLGHAFEDRVADPTAARDYASRAASCTEATPPVHAEAIQLLADVCLTAHDASCALAAVSATDVPATVRARVTQRIWRPRLAAAALGVDTAVVVVSTAVIAKRRARLTLPRRKLALAAATSLVIALAGVIASRYEASSPAPFLGLGAAVLAVSSLGALVQEVVNGGNAAKLLRAALFSAAVVCAAFLCLYVVGPDYLADFGL